MSPEMLIAVFAYLLVTFYLGYRGYKETKTATDYLLAGRGTHPIIMALSYGSSFISTSAIVGFGGIASQFGMSMLWLTFFNIMVGIFVAFVFIGKRVRRIGHALDAHTFPELIGRRFNSIGMQRWAGILIFVFMPVYAAAVLIGGAAFMKVTFGIGFDAALFIFAIVVAAYVIAGGLKGVLYTDAMQGLLMLVGAIFLIVSTYVVVSSSGTSPTGKALQGLVDTGNSRSVHALLGDTYSAIKTRNASPEARTTWLQTSFSNELGLVLNAERIQKLDSIAKGLIKDPEREKKFLAAAGAIVPQLGTNVALSARAVKRLVTSAIEAADIKRSESLGFEGWDKTPKGGSPAWWLIFSTFVLGVGIGVLAQPQLIVRFMTVKSDKDLNRGVGIGGLFILVMTGGSFVVGALSNVYFSGAPEFGTSAIAAAMGNPDDVIPLFINSSMPKWFVTLFMLTLLAAAMSTLSSQFHALGTAFSRDILRLGIGKKEVETKTIFWTKIGIVAGLVVTVILGYSLGEGVIARGTSIFFGLAAASFLPLFVGGLYSKRVTRTGAILSFGVGTASSLIWMLFFNLTPANALGLCKAIFGKPALTMTLNEQGALVPTTWAFVDALVIALPLSVLALVVGSALSQDERKDLPKI